MALARIKTLVTVSNALIAGILDGVPLSEPQKLQLLNQTGLSWEVVRDVDSRTSILILARLWNEVLRLTKNEFIGIEIGRSVPAERFGLAVHTAQQSKNFRDGLLRFAKYAALINDLIKCDLTEAEGKAHFTMKFYWDVFGLERHAVDIAFTCISTWTSQRFGSRFKLDKVLLRHSLKSHGNEYEKIFNAPVTFGAKTNELIFDSALLETNFTGTNPELGLILDHYASAELTRIPVLSDLPAGVAQILSRELKGGRSVDLAAVSAELKMTTRHLQRKLNESSTSFSSLLDAARKSLAPKLLIQPEANVEQVGFQLGYSEPTAFIRAFKKWYGLTPGEYRKKNTT